MNTRYKILSIAILFTSWMHAQYMVTEETGTLNKTNNAINTIHKITFENNFKSLKVVKQ